MNSIVLAVGNIPPYAQSMLHMLIAINRFTAFFYPMDHSTIWSNRLTGGTIVAVMVLSVLLHIVPFYGIPLFIPNAGSTLEWNYLNGYEIQV